MSQTLQSVLCITTNKYLVHVLVVLLHARFSVVGPIPFLLAAIFFSVHPYIGSTTVLPDNTHKSRRPGERCTTSALVCTSCTLGVQENAAIGLVLLQSAEILWLIICFAIHFLRVTTA